MSIQKNNSYELADVEFLITCEPTWKSRVWPWGVCRTIFNDHLKTIHKQIDQIESQIQLVEEDIAAIRNALSELEKQESKLGRGKGESYTGSEWD